MRGRLSSVVLAATIIASPAAAQSWSPLASDVFTRLAWAEVSARETWRDFERGSAGVRVGGAYSQGGPGEGTNSFVLLAEAQSALANRTTLSDRLHAGATVIHELANEGRLWLGIDGSVLPKAKARTATAEVSAGLRYRLPVIRPENHPVLVVEGAGDVVRYKTAYLRTALRLDAKAGNTLGAYLEGGQAWSGLPGGEAIGSVPFGNHGTDVTFTLLRQSDAATVKSGDSTKSMEMFIRGLWVGRNADPNRFDGGVRLTLVY